MAKNSVGVFMRFTRLYSLTGHSRKPRRSNNSVGQRGKTLGGNTLGKYANVTPTFIVRKKISKELVYLF